MKSCRYTLPFIIFSCLCFVNAWSQDRIVERERDRDRGHDEALNEEDLKLLRNYLAEKRDERAEKEKKGGFPSGLTLSGEIHVEWRHLTEKLEGCELRGGPAKDCKCIRLGKNDFDMEFDIRLDYRSECTWAKVHLQFDNPAGVDKNECCCSEVDCDCGKEGSGPCRLFTRSPHKRKDRFHGSGDCDDICLKRAFFGYNIFKNDCGRLDIELGRRQLYDVFESEIQYLSRFDGFLLKYSNLSKSFADWYVQFAGFVVDERVNHYAWATELALFNICDSQFDFKYSMIDWRKRGFSRCGEHNPCGSQFLNSHVVFTYHFNKEFCWNMPAEVYLGGVFNHLAKHADDAWGSYIGFTLGKVDKANDWSLDVQYHYIKKRAMSWDDQTGIGLSNILEDCCQPAEPTVGYQGARAEFLYALTDDLVVDTIAEIAVSTQHTRHRYSKFEIEAVYSF